MLTTTQEPGSLLKATREAKGITLTTVHEATKIPMDVLRAIEEGYTVRTLSPFYLKGFTKMYAEYLHVNMRELGVENKKPTAAKVAPVILSSTQEEFDLNQWMKKIFTDKHKQQLAAIVGLFIFLFILFKVITFFTHKHSSPVSKETIRKEKAALPKSNRSSEKISTKKAQTVVSVPQPIQASALKLPVKAVVVIPVQPVAAARQAAKDVTLTIRAKKDSWLRVEADGNVVFQSSLLHGKSESWVASDKIEISGKNMQQLEFEFNGKFLGVLSNRDRNAKKIIITKEGLSVVQ